VAKFYLPPSKSQWACRQCHDLGYTSQRKGPAFRAIRSAQKIRERLGGSANLFAPFPERPKGMHWRTYQRFREAEVKAKVQAARSLFALRALSGSDPVPSPEFRNA
jgi:hypothetical protein